MRIAIALFGVFLSVGAALAAGYPVYQTRPFQAEHKDSLYNLRLFQSTGELVSSAVDNQSVFVAALYMLRDGDDDGYTACGGAVVGKVRKTTQFVISHAHVYTDVDDAGWQALGCNTKGGTMLKWVPRDDGGNDIRVITEPLVKVKQKAAPIASPPPPAKPPVVLPLEGRLRMVIRAENTLSQILGAETQITSDHAYQEQNGDTTFCIVGRAAGKQVRILMGPGEPKIGPSQAQWISGGCTRPNYILLK